MSKYLNRKGNGKGMDRKAVTGIVLTLLLISMLFSTVPVRSTPAGIMLTPPGVMSASDGTIKIGVVGPNGSLQWDGLWEGAQMARDEINGAGGINIGGAFYNIELVAIDEHSVPTPDPSAAVAELVAALASGVDFLIGGFRTECVFPMCEAAMDYAAVYGRPIWIIAGASTNSLMEAVGTDYERYKYMFRVAPVNSTYLAASLISFLAGWILPHTLIPLYGSPVNTYIVAEDLVWCDAIPPALQYYLDYTSGLYPVCNFTGVARPSPLETDFSPILEDVEAKDARLLIHLFSAEAGASFISQWRDMEVEAVPVGINVVSQKNEFWEQTGGKCEHETILAVSGTKTPLSAGALAFYDEILSRYGHAPIYTSWGAYEAIYTLAEAFEGAGTTDSDTVVAELEQTDRNSILGRFKFTQYHDVFCNEMGANWEEGYVRPLVCQWWKSPRTGKARLEVVWPQDQVYSRKWRIPTWIYPLAETDFDYDGVVSVIDLLFCLGVAYGATAGDQWWNPDCDIDGNGIINMVDVAKFALDYGKHWEPGAVGASVQTASSIPTITQTDSTTTVYLDPPTINGTGIVNGNVTVYLKISDAVNVTTWEAGIAFNASLLECLDVDIGDFLEFPEVFDSFGNINNTSGEITRIGRSVMGNYSDSGNGTLAKITFKVKKEEVSDLHLRDTIVVDYWGAENCIPTPFNIIDTYTITSSAAQTVFTVSNSTGVEPDGFEFVDGEALQIWLGSGFYSHAFSHSANQISFNVTGPDSGWSNATIPKTLLDISTLDQVLVIIDNVPLKTDEITVEEKNLTHYFVYFEYDQGIHNIRILKRPPVYNTNKNLYYATIQEAIKAASSRDKILAYAGIHYGNVVVNKSVSLIGENKHNTTIYGSPTGTVINVTATNVNITGFTIQNSGSEPYDSGIWVHHSSDNNITNNIITNNWAGICLYGSSDNTLAGNNASNNHIGILLDSSSNNTLTNNTMSGNKYNFGLYGTKGSHFNNTIDESNKVDGKLVYYMKNVPNAVYNSSSVPNAGTLYLINCTNVTIRNLTLTKNVNGIFLWNTNNSNIQNVTTSNNKYGIYLDSSNNNTIYHNSFIENTIQADVTVAHNNLWDNGYRSGGNYWSDHSINPPFVVDEYKGENQSVQGNDGIIDDPKIIGEENQDNYPLVSPLTPPVYNLNTHQGYTTIQGAINSSQSGHMIIVRNGTYPEQVTIGKALTLIGIMGSTVINGTGTVVTITADPVTFRGFTIQGSGSTDKGILVDQANNTVISENTITNKGYGIWLDQAHHCNISGNTITNNTEAGIRLEFSGSAIINRNTLTNNQRGISLSYSSNNDVHRNNITGNTWGISLSSSSNNMIYHNSFNNTNQVHSEISTNTWDNNVEGNYWNDYTGVDNNPKDGIGDTPYNVTDTVPVQQDRYPLMSPRTPQHGVALVSVTPSKTVVGQGYPISITVTIENHGDYTEKFNVTACYNETAIILPDGKNYTTITVTSESFTPISFTWNTTGVPYGNYTTITANATIVPGETNTTDNTYTDGWVVVTIAGDVNGNGVVESKDLIFGLGPAYGSRPGDPNWNPNADLNGNGVVESTDLIFVFAPNNGKRWPD
jgi:branched-chain amino acid transport system substrate-binding protein